MSSRRGELALVVWGVITFAAILASFSAFRPVRDALILDGNPEDIPWLFTGTFIAVSIASPLWSALLARRQKRRVVPIAFHVFAVCALGFAWLVHQQVEPIGVGRAFYIWSSVYNLFVVSVFWSLLADLIGPDVARRLFGPIAAGGTIGALVGPFLTKLLVGTVDVAGILVMSAILLELAVFGVWRIRVIGEGLERAPADDVKPSTAWTGLERVARSPYLAAIVGYVLCTATAATFLYLEQAAIVKSEFTTRVARTDYFASLDLWTAGATIVVQMLIARPLLGWLGPGLVLCALPIAQLAGISALATAPSLTVLAIAQITNRTITHGLTRPARELLFTVVDREDKYHAKNVIDTIAYRGGDFASSWLHAGLVAIGAGNAVLVVASIPIVGSWIGLAAILGIGFRKRAKETGRSPNT